MIDKNKFKILRLLQYEGGRHCVSYTSAMCSQVYQEMQHHTRGSSHTKWDSGYGTYIYSVHYNIVTRRKQSS